MGITFHNSSFPRDLATYMNHKKNFQKKPHAKLWFLFYPNIGKFSKEKMRYRGWISRVCIFQWESCLRLHNVVHSCSAVALSIQMDRKNISHPFSLPWVIANYSSTVERFMIENRCQEFSSTVISIFESLHYGWKHLWRQILTWDVKFDLRGK